MNQIPAFGRFCGQVLRSGLPRYCFDIKWQNKSKSEALRSFVKEQFVSQDFFNKISAF
jgi:hypothetical protein